MRKIWTSGLHIHQEINGEAQRIMIAVEHLGSEIPSIDGQHDIWVHSSDYEKLQEQNKILREALEFYADKNNWEDDNIDISDTEPRKEIFNGTTLNYYEGGKRAREALAKVKEC